MQQFLCFSIIEDDVNSVDLFRQVSILSAVSSDACLSRLQAEIEQKINEMGISEESNPALNQLFIEAHCQSLEDGMAMDTREFGSHPTSYRSMWKRF